MSGSRSRPAPRGAVALAGVGPLGRLAARRDRVMLPIWCYALIALSASTAYSFRNLYPTAASRDRFAAVINTTPAARAIYGRVQDASLGGLTAWRIGVLAATLTAVMSILLVVRHTRAEEYAGRQELVSASPVGRYAPITAALGLATAADLVVALGTALVLALLGLPIAGDLALGLAIGGCGWLFAALAALIAQLVDTPRAATGLTSAVLGALYLARAAADAGGPDWLRWMTPLGWVGSTQAYAGDRWWVLALPLAFGAALSAGAVRLSGRRDHGSGVAATLVPHAWWRGAVAGRRRPEAAIATRPRGPLGLAWRLHRGALLGWAAGFALAGGVVGSIAKDVGGLIDSSAGMERFINEIGGRQGLVDAYLAAVFGIMSVVAGAYAVQATLRLREEENDDHAEPLLATSLGRVRWMLSHLLVAAAGSAVLLVAMGAAAGLAHGLRTHDVTHQLPSLTAAALAQWPAVTIVLAITALLFGAAPRLASLAWGALAAFLILGQFGSVLGLPQPVMDLSPFTHIPKLPGSGVAFTPLLSLTGLAIALLVAALTAFRHRDLQ